MRKILVTGARGLLGCSLVPRLRAAGYAVVANARGVVDGVQADLSDREQATAALNAVQPEAIVNLAALTDVDACERDPQLAYLANVRLVENLAHWIRLANSGCHLVQISTDQVYDGAGPHSEDSVRLWNYYGFSKYAGELAAGSVRGTVLRTNFFGPSRAAHRASLSDWIVRSLRSGAAITVFEDVRFSPLAIGTLVDMIERVLRTPRPGVYNLGASEGMSKADFAFALAAALDLPTAPMSRGTVAAAKLAAPRPKDMRLDCARFESAFGVRLPTLAQEILSMKQAYADETAERH